MNRRMTMKTISAVLLFFASLFLVSGGTAQASTPVGGFITADTTWTLAGSPYIVELNVMVQQGVTLTIQPGVVVKFTSGKTLQVNGTLVAIGQAESPVLFTSNQAEPAPGDWDCISFTSTSTPATFDGSGNYVSGSILEYCTVEFGGSINGCLVKIDTAAPFINASKLTESSTKGIKLTGSGSLEVKIKQSVISENNGDGIYYYDHGPGLSLEGCTVENNNGHGVYFFSYTGMIASDGNKIKGNRTSGLFYSTYEYSPGGHVQNNIIADNNGPGLYWDHETWDTSIQNSVTISGNIISGNNSSAPALTFYGYNNSNLPNIIENNLIYHNNSTWGESVFIDSNYYYRALLTVNDNVFAGNKSSYPLSLEGCMSFSGNSLVQNVSDYGHIAYRNFSASSSCTSQPFSNNTFHGNETYNADRTSLSVYNLGTLTNNNLFDNDTDYILRNSNGSSTDTFMAQDNFWGYTREEDIQKVIYDWFMDSSLGLVDFTPFLLIPDTTAPISPPTGFSVVRTSQTGALDTISTSWSANPEADVAGYIVYWGTQDGPPYETSQNVGNTTSYVITGLTPGQTYFVTVTAYDIDYKTSNDDPLTPVNENQTHGHESWYAPSYPFRPTADFTGTPTSGEYPLTVQFTSTSTGEIKEYAWTFGDGYTSSEANPSHIYHGQGTFDVTLTVTGPGGTHTTIKAEYIATSYPTPPTANFSGTPRSGTAPLKVDFKDESTGKVTYWYWSFGDGYTSSEQNPSHTYYSGGTYTVSLYVEGPGGDDDSKEIANYVVVAPPPPPTASFTMNPSSGVTPLEVKFTDTSTGSITSWYWRFGDGYTSTTQNPVHTYRRGGNYTVQLTVDGPGGTASTSQTLSVTNSPPIADFGAKPKKGRTPLTVQFRSHSQNLVDSYLWDFGDGSGSTSRNPSHVYTKSGSFAVSLTVVGPGGESTKKVENYITVLPSRPVPAFSAEPSGGKVPLVVQFHDESTQEVTAWLWTFGDGTTSTERNPVHTYSNIGSYTVTLKVTGPGGSRSLKRVGFINVIR